MKYCAYMYAAMLPLAAVSAAEEPDVVSAVSFELHEASDRSDELLGIAEKLVAFREQQPMDAGALRRSIRALRTCGMFERIGVERSAGGVKFLLTPARYVRDIQIRQAYPLFTDEVEKALSISPGDVFRKEVLVRQDSMITALYRREGFVAPRVDITSRRHRSGRDRVVLVRVHAGEYYRIETIEIKGNRGVSAIAIKLRMKSWWNLLLPGSAGRFIESVLREDVKKLADFYRLRRFADVAIRDTVIADSRNRSVRVVLSITEGERYKILLPPRRERGFGRRALADDITLLKTGNRNNAGVRKAVREIGKRMREAGFLDARVSVSDTSVARRRVTERRVRFSIARGTRTTVSSIIIRGADGIDEAAIRDQMLHVDKGSEAKRAYDPDRLREDVFAVQMLYRSRGFLKATVASTVAPQGASVAITIDIREGKRTFIGGVSVDTARFSGIAVRKAVTVKTGDAYRSDRLNRDARVLQTMIAEQGYPHVSVTPVVAMNSDSSSAEVEFRIDKGPKVMLGDIRYVGAFRTKEKVLNRQFRGLRGRPLSLRGIVDAQKKMRDLGLFSAVRFKTVGLREKRDTVHLFVDVTEKRPFHGTLGGGYQSDKKIFLNAKAGDRNLLGFGREAWVAGEVSHIDSALVKGDFSRIDGHAEVGMLDPRLFGSPLRAMVNVFGERESELNQDWWTRNYGLSTGLTASPDNRLMLGLGTNYEHRRLYYKSGASPADSVKVSGELRPRDLIVMTPSFSWDRRDSFTRPRKGFFLSSSVDFSKSIGAMIDNFVKAQFEAKGVFTPHHSRFTWAGVVRGGYLRPYGGAEGIPADQLFYLGGTGDVRGFAENCFNADTSGRGIGGSVSLSASVEGRIAVGGPVELALFADIGRLEDDLISMAPEQFRSSVGAGIRYITPIGPIGILYGWKLFPLPGEDAGAFHFSLGYTF
ncbi:MAG: BamA/TamA family outer membrane protein [Chitinispirillaceae bacterium]|nr:BamA/TamA family outer membrane protein [Chitinispirillaceae bacterium]